MAAPSQITVAKFIPNDPRLGRHIEHDDRSKRFAFLPKQTKPKGITTRWPSHAPTLDQLEIGSCTGNAPANVLNTDFANAIRKLKHGGKYLNEQDAVAIYSRATHLDNIKGSYLPDDTGSSGIGAAKACVEAGYFSGYSHLFSFSSVQAAIELTPLIVGTTWTNSMFTPNNGLMKVGPLVQSNIAGGHEYAMTGIDFGAQVFEFRQSWGDGVPGFKPGGYFAITFRDFVMLLADQGDATVPKLAA